MTEESIKPPKRPRKGSLAALFEEIQEEWNDKPKPDPERKSSLPTHSEYDEWGLRVWPKDRGRGRTAD